MPVDVLTAAQIASYGRFTAEPSPAQLARSFHLDDADHAVIAQHRGAHNKLGFALQLSTVRFLGAFLPDPTDVPAGAIAYLAAQLALEDTACLQRYRDGQARFDHTATIRRHYGYRDFTDQPEHFRLVRWLYTRAWVSADRPSLPK